MLANAPQNEHFNHLSQSSFYTSRGKVKRLQVSQCMYNDHIINAEISMEMASYGGVP